MRVGSTRRNWEFRGRTLRAGYARGDTTEVATRSGGEARSGWYPRCAKTQADEDLTAFVCTRVREEEEG